MTRTVLVTGAAGFVGSHLLEHLRSAGDAWIVGFGRRPAAVAACDEFVVGDVGSRADMLHLVRETRPDEVYHLAGIARGSEADLEAVNVMGTRYLLEAVAAHCPEAALVVTGSAAEYGASGESGTTLTEEDACEPIGAYGRSKHRATREVLAVAEDGLRVNVVRPFNLVGAGVPERLFVGAVAARLRELRSKGGCELRVGSLGSVRDFVDVGDTVAGMVALARSGQTGRVFNLCSGRPRSMGELIIELARIADLDVVPLEDPALVRADEINVSVGSHRAATTAFGFQPVTPLAESLTAVWTEPYKGRATA